MLNESKQYKTLIFDVDMWKSYIWTVDFNEVWSVWSSLPTYVVLRKAFKIQVWMEFETLTSEMAVQLPIEQSGLPPSYVSSVKETATTTHSKLQHKTILIICKYMFFYKYILKWHTHYPCQWIVDTVLAFVCNFMPISLSPSLSNVRQHPCSQSYWEKLLLNNN